MASYVKNKTQKKPGYDHICTSENSHCSAERNTGSGSEERNPQLGGGRGPGRGRGTAGRLIPSLGLGREDLAGISLARRTCVLSAHGPPHPFPKLGAARPKAPPTVSQVRGRTCEQTPTFGAALFHPWSF